MGGGDKSLLPLRGRALIAHVIARLAPQVDRLAINANGDPARFAAFGLPVLADPLPDHQGPLAGLLAALDWAAATGASQVVTAAADTPFLPADLVARLRKARLMPQGQAAAALAATPDATGRQAHPVFGLWDARLAPELRAFLAGGQRRVSDFAGAVGAATALFPDPSAFFNANTPADLARAEAMAAASTGLPKPD
jgi:molybdopterin-guanine dinucleotide biosynthesis protein A